MKKITLIAVALMTGYLGQAQLNFEASADFGKLMNVTYDAHTANKLYAATQGNHIVVSTDNGAHWNILYSHPSGDFLADLRLAPGNSVLSFATRNNIYFFSLLTNAVTATIAVPQNGVDGAGPSYVSSYSAYDATGTILLVDTGFPLGFSSQGKTFYTKDGGTTWAELYYTVNHDNVFVNNVAICPTDSKKLFLARGLGDSGVNGGLWMSPDEGANWVVKLVDQPLDPIAFKPGNSDELFVGSGISFGAQPEGLYHSTDGGATWNEQTIEWTNETLNNITTIEFNPANPSEIIALEENEIARSTDNGATWTNSVYPVGISMDYYYGIHASFNPFDNNQIAITTDFYPQFLNKSNLELTQIKAPFYNTISTSVGTYGTEKNLYYGAQGGRFHKNIGTTAISVYDTEDPNSFNPKRNYMIADPKIPGRVFTYASMGFFGGFLNVSTDYGATTTNILQAFADDIQELTIDPNNNKVIYVSMRSGEGGSMIKIDFSDFENIITTDIMTPEVSEFGEGVVTGIVVAGTDSNTIYITKKTQFFKSADGGQTWTASNNGLEDINADTDLIWDMTQSPLNANQLTLSSNIGIYTSTDSGENWTLLLGNRDVRRVKHSPENPNVIIGTVFSNMYESASIVYTTDNGENWTSITSEMLDHVQSYAMDYDFNGAVVNAYISTSDLGIVQYVINDVFLGIRPVSDSKNVGLYPNPATSRVSIITDDNLDSVSIYSLNGQKVLEGGSSKTIDISGFANGIYIVKANTVSGKHLIQKLVKE